MHCEPKDNVAVICKKNRCKGVFLGTMVGLLSACNPRTGQQAVETPPRTAVATIVKMHREIILSAPVRAKVSSTVTAAFQGRIQKIYITKGQRVKKGQPLIELVGDDLEFRLSQAEVDLKIAEKERDRQKSIGNTKSHGADDPSPEFDLAICELRVQKAKLTRDAIADKLKASQVTSPVDGVVINVYAEEGKPVQGPTAYNSGTALCEVADSSEYALNVEFNEFEVAQVHEGQRVEIFFDSIPNLKVQGLLDSIMGAGRTSMRYSFFPATIVFSTIANDVRIGATATVRINVEAAGDGVAVPAQAISYSGGKSYVNVLAGNKMARREVILGLHEGELVELRAGLSAGEQVVLTEAQ
jgi:RND family efflux transporter MFP subunit